MLFQGNETDLSDLIDWIGLYGVYHSVILVSQLKCYYCTYVMYSIIDLKLAFHEVKPDVYSNFKIRNVT